VLGLWIQTTEGAKFCLTILNELLQFCSLRLKKKRIRARMAVPIPSRTNPPDIGQAALARRNSDPSENMSNSPCRSFSVHRPGNGGAWGLRGR
jgi:hypothetical protein